MKFNVMFYGGVDEKGESSMCTTYNGCDGAIRAYKIMEKERDNYDVKICDISTLVLRDINQIFGVHADTVVGATVRERFDEYGSKVYCEYAFFTENGRSHTWEYSFHSDDNKTRKKWHLVHTIG